MSRWILHQHSILIAWVLFPLALQAHFTPEAGSDFSLSALHGLYAAKESLRFTENKGQWDERALFKAEGDGGLTWWIERDGFTLLYSVPEDPQQIKQIKQMDSQQITQIAQIGEAPESAKAAKSAESVKAAKSEESAKSAVNYRSHALKFKFQNALPRPAGSFIPQQTTPASAASVEAFDKLPWNNNYFLGNNPSRWAPDCGNFQRVVLKDVWPGVDVCWRVTEQRIDSQQITQMAQIGEAPESAKAVKSAVNLVEFDFIIHPDADPNQIQVECLGLTGDLETTADGGELLLPTSLGVIRQALPEAYQIDEDGSLSPVPAEFTIKGAGNSFGVSLPAEYDPARPLIVDPLVYSTYLGGSSENGVYALTLDGAGGVIAAGGTLSEDFPTTEGALDTSFNGNKDVFIARLNPSGRALRFSTYLGGENYDCANALVPDGAGGVFVTGFTSSEGFPTTEGACQTSLNGGSSDAFVTRLSNNGSELLGSTFLGGSFGELACAVASDGSGGVVLTGCTEGVDFPLTSDAYCRMYNGGSFDVFLSRLTSGLDTLVYSTYFGGDNSETAYALASDSTGEVVVAGLCNSNNLPTTEGAFDRRRNGDYDAFIARFNSEGSELRFCTFLGGWCYDQAGALALDESGNIVVTGWTLSDDFPTTAGAFDRTISGSTDAFAARLSADGSELLWGTYIGGSDFEEDGALMVDETGCVIVAGGTFSNNFPTTGDAFNRSLNGNRDIFLVRFNQTGSGLLYSTYFGGANRDIANALALDDAGGIVMAGETWSDNLPLTEGAVDGSFNYGIDAFVVRINGIGLAVRERNAPAAPSEYSLSEPYPNPFNSTTGLTFALPEAGWVQLSIYDLNGRLVETIIKGELSIGVHTVHWNAEGRPSGLYLARLECQGLVAAKKLTLVK